MNCHIILLFLSIFLEEHNRALVEFQVPLQIYHALILLFILLYWITEVEVSLYN